MIIGLKNQHKDDRRILSALSPEVSSGDYGEHFKMFILILNFFVIDSIKIQKYFTDPNRFINMPHRCKGCHP
jgi:hypothetical protein